MGQSKRRALIGAFLAFGGLFVIQLYPVHGGVMNLLTLGLVGASWLSVVMLTWNRTTIRKGVLLAPAFVVVPFLLPGRDLNRDELKADYLERLGGYEGTPYYWGGESSRGIDCSGLMRRAYRDALLWYGVRKVDGGALRLWAEQWWFDTSAKAMGEGYRGFTVALDLRGTIRSMDLDEVEKGDLAVTKGGAHVLVYVGQGKWTPADPGAGEVVTLHGKEEQNSWFKIPVSLHRWKIFTEDP